MSKTQVANLPQIALKALPSQNPRPVLGTAGGPGPARAEPLLTNAPSTAVPMRFMLAGVLSFMVGLALVVLRPDVLATYHYHQKVIAVTHLFVLGWISTIVMGAMYQLVPVALETRLHSERLAAWQFGLHVIGFAGMVWMFWVWNLKQVGHFGVVLGIGVALFAYNIIRTLGSVPRWNFIATSVASALAWLGLALLAGLTIATAKSSYEIVSTAQSGFWGAVLEGMRATGRFMARFDAIGAMHAHAHLGVVGVFLMLIVGISYKLVPMFTISEVQSPKRAVVSILLLNLGLACLFFGILLRSRAKPLFAGLILLAIVLYGAELRAILRARKRRSLDWGMRGFLTAVGLLAPLSILGLILSLPGLPLTTLTGQLENVYGLTAIIGVVSFAIIGMLYKIIPFLVWYRTYSSHIGRARVPALAELYSSNLQASGYWSFLAGLTVAIIGTLTTSPLEVRFGALLLLASALCLAANIVKMLSHIARPRIKPLLKPALSKA